MALCLLAIEAACFFAMPEGKMPQRHWRVVALELAREQEPQKIRALLQELTQAIDFVRYEELDEPPRGTKPV